MINTAHIVRVGEGVAYVDDPILNQLTGFAFGKIQGYHGQTAEELNLRPGREVKVEYDADVQVSSVLISS